MFLPPPASPSVFPSKVVYHLYGMDTTLEKDEPYTDKRGRKDTMKVKAKEIAYLNMVIPTREAEAYRKAKGLVDFGFNGFVCDKRTSHTHYHNCYGLDESGGRNLTNVIVYHKDVYDGKSPHARVVIGDEATLFVAMNKMLKHQTDLPYLDAHVPEITMRAKRNGLVSFRASLEWETPIWYIKRDLKSWNKVIEEFFKNGAYRS